MSKWGNLGFTDIGNLSKLALKTVEKTIDRAIGIPDTVDNNSNNNTNNTSNTNTQQQHQQQQPQLASPIQPPKDNVKNEYSTILDESMMSSLNQITHDLPISPIKPTTNPKQSNTIELPKDPSLIIERENSQVIEQATKPEDNNVIVQDDNVDKDKNDTLVIDEDQNNESSLLSQQPQDIPKPIEPMESNSGNQTKIKQDLQSQSSPTTSTTTTSAGINEQQQYQERIKLLESKLSVLVKINQEKDNMIVEREKQLEKLSVLNSKIQDTNDKLLIDINELTNSQKKEDIENLKEEFSRRMGELEKKLKIITKERDSLKSGQSMSDSLSNTLKDKDEQIKQLRTEGETLSQKLGTLESTLKKLRSQNKENEETIQMLNERINSTETLLQNKADKLKSLEDSDRKYQDTILTMKDVTEMTTKKFEEKDLVAEKATKQSIELQSALEKAWRDISDLNKQHQLDLEKQQRSIDIERQKEKERWQASLAMERKEWQSNIDALQQTINNQKIEIERITERLTTKDNDYNRHIEHLNQRCREAEQRNDQLSSSIPETTRPLIKQIESLQNANNLKQQSWEILEKSLQQQLREAKINLETSTQNEQEAINELEEITIKYSAMENELKKEKQQIKTFNAESINKNKMLAENESKIKELSLLIDQLKNDKSDMENNIVHLEERLEKSYRDFKEAEELRSQREKILNQQILNSNNNNNQTNSNQQQQQQNLNSSSGSIGEGRFWNSNVRNSSHHDLYLHGQSSPTTTGAPISSSTTAFPMEIYQSSLNQKDGEIAILQSQYQKSESIRKTLEDQLIKLTTSNEQLLAESKEYKNLRSELKEMEQRYNTALEVLGEKEEQVSELKLDLMEMKEIYKNQIIDLLAKAEGATSQNNKK